MANIERLDATLAVVEEAAKRGEHDQSQWAFTPAGSMCGTTHCFAGWGAVQAKLPMWWYTHYDGNRTATHVLPDGPGGIAVDFEQWGREHYELTFGQASALFILSKTLEDVRSVIERIKAGDEFENASKGYNDLAQYDRDRANDFEWLNGDDWW